MVGYFEKFHWEFIDRGDHIDVYEQRGAYVAGGFYPPNSPTTIQDIIDKTKDMTEDDVYNFIHENITFY